MELMIRRLEKDEADLFNREDERAFNVHAPLFPGGVVPGAAEEERGEYDLRKIMDDPRFSVFSLRDGGRFAGGAIVEDLGNGRREISIFFLAVEYQGRGIGRTALDMVEACFPDTEYFTLITPSNVVRNVAFYVNKCGYRITEVVGFDRETNTADYVLTKKNPRYAGKNGSAARARPVITDPSGGNA